ncbi:hypothetical protein CEXT_463601 [Caerostris extrusa]|uniref:Uncharacterized protein n=1 Tax=Caerostris extrusa TaxID=172846 RepID=A0AAV4UNU1_CAEEX|nr:hypothetical protein CEXT_463601 [Caerostris extrusa]
MEGHPQAIKDRLPERPSQGCGGGSSGSIDHTLSLSGIKTSMRSFFAIPEDICLKLRAHATRALELPFINQEGSPVIEPEGELKELGVLQKGSQRPKRLQGVLCFLPYERRKGRAAGIPKRRLQGLAHGRSGMSSALQRLRVCYHRDKAAEISVVLLILAGYKPPPSRVENAGF